MNRRNIILLIVLGVLILIGISSYNRLVNREVEVQQSWSEVQSAYQRRADLIPGLVETVKGVSNFEKSTLKDVIDARAKATSIKIEAKDLTPENMQKIQNAYGQMNSALGRLLAVAENYPELKATQAYTDFMRENTGTENRINFARDNYNAKVANYNKSIRKFPSNIFANIFGFDAKSPFAADAGAEKRVDFKFD